MPIIPEFSKKHAIYLAISIFVIVGVVALFTGVKNYYDYFAGFFVGFTFVFCIIWIIIMIRTLTKK